MQEAFYYSLREQNKKLVPARVVFTSHDHFRVLLLGADSERQAHLRGHYYHSGQEPPAVGDWVTVELEAGDHASLPIADLLPRVTSLRRALEGGGEQTMLANVTHIALVTSFNQDLNERRLERGLAMVSDSGAHPLIIINKEDLVSPPLKEKLLVDLAERFVGAPLLACSAHTGQGIGEIKNYFKPGECLSLLGMSGVGKSTLINALLSEARLATQAIREDDSRGRHTTTHRELIRTKENFWLLDSPGIREFSYAGDEDDLVEAFSDIAELIGRCRFRDCAHKQEPGCSVQLALENGELSRDRWENFLKLKREADYHANKNNKAYISAKRKVWKKLMLK